MLQRLLNGCNSATLELSRGEQVLPVHGAGPWKLNSHAQADTGAMMSGFFTGATCHGALAQKQRGSWV